MFHRLTSLGQGVTLVHHPDKQWMRSGKSAYSYPCRCDRTLNLFSQPDDFI